MPCNLVPGSNSARTTSRGFPFRFRAAIAFVPVATSPAGRIRRTQHFAVALGVIMLFAQAALAQGIQPFSTQAPGPFSTVDMASTYVLVSIPIRNKVGAIPFQYSLIANSAPKTGLAQYQTALNGQLMGPGGLLSASIFFQSTPVTCGIYFTTKLDHFALIDSTGATHPFPPADDVIISSSSNCSGGGFTAQTTDGSGYTITVSRIQNGASFATTVWDKSGNVQSSSSALNTPDGNSISVAGGNYPSYIYTDTLGQAVLTVTVNNPHSVSTPDTYVYTDKNGGNQTYSVAYTSMHWKTNYGCQDYDVSGVFFPTTITETPSGQRYTISYEPTPGYPGDTTGRIQQITFPSGGYVKYSYSGGSNGIQCSISIPVVPTLTKTVNDGNGHSNIWTYVNGRDGSHINPFNVTETDPAGNQSVYTFYNEYQLEKQVYQGSVSPSNLISTTVTCYNGNFANCPTTNPTAGMGVMPVIYQTDVFTYPGNSSSASLIETKYNITINGLGVPIGAGTIAEIKKYDFGAATSLPPTAAPTISPVADTIITYDGNGASCGALAANSNIDDRPCSITTTNSSGATVSQVNYTYNSAGHPTQTSTLVSGSTYLTSSNSYNTNGAMASSTDVNGAVTNYFYNGTGGCNNLLLTSTSLPVNSLSTSQTWDCNGGVLTSSTDENGQVTSYSYVNPSTSVADPFWRQTQATYPDGGGTTTTYSTGTSLPWSISTSTAIISGTNLNNTTIYDGLARVTQTQLTSDPDGTDYVDTTYDSVGRKSTVSNPHRSGSLPTDGTTTYSYDALDRVTSVLKPDGSQTSSTYNSNCTTVTDEAGKARKSCVDGLDRLTQVFEDPGSSPHLNYETDYSYDALGNLICIQQQGGVSTPSGTGCAYSSSGDSTSPWRIRRFAYDGISRLTSASNPESGAISYTYDGNGNVLTKTAPKPNQTGTATTVTTYYYDALNRLTKKTYNDGSTPTVQFAYDNNTITGCTIAPPSQTDSNPKGYRTSMCDGSGGTTWTHDQMGRILSERRTIGGVLGAYDSTEVFNLDGSISSLTALGYSVAYTYNGAGRPMTAVNSADSFNYVTSTAYAPFGGLTGASMGSKPITISNAYNNRLQPTTLSASTTPATIMSLSYDFHSSTHADNGNVFQITNNRDGNRTQNFMYDSLNRIQQAYTTGTNWGETFSPTATSPGVAPSTSGIDAWGNLAHRSGVTGKTSYEPLDCPANAKNQLSACSLSYDAAGNGTSSGSAIYTYDAENRLISAGGMSYIYDGDGKRVKKCTAGTTPGTCATNPTGTLYWTGTGSDPLVETDLAGNVLENYIFFKGKRIARRDASTHAVHYYFSDYLGTHSLITDANGTMPPQEESDFYPYGGEILVSGSDPNHYKFTGKERDAESGLDNFGARFDASSLGRFIIPDPLYLEVHRLGDPQQLNLYAYGKNNPLKFTDPSGMDIYCVGTEEYCAAYLAALQKDVSFKIGYDENGKVVAVGDVDKKSLSKSDKQFLSAIDDDKHHVTIEAVGGKKDSSVFFGADRGGTHNQSTHTINFDQAKLLDDAKNAGGYTSAQLVGHETLEAYGQSKGMSQENAHNYATGSGFPGLDQGRTTQLFGGYVAGTETKAYTGVTTQFTVHGRGITENIRIDLVTPVPNASMIPTAAKYPVSVERPQP
jgi:RHS repeat-associated protein